MKAIDIVRMTTLPVPRDEFDKLVAESGRRLSLQLVDIDPHLLGMDCSGDGSRVLGYGRSTVLLWDNGSSLPRARTTLPGGITRAAISNSGDRAIVGTMNGDVYVLELPEFNVVAHRNDGVAIFDAHIANRKLGVFCDANGRVAAFHTSNGEDAPPVPGTGNQARVWLSADGKSLLVDDENEIILYHPDTQWIEQVYSYADNPHDDEGGVLSGGWMVSKRDTHLYIWNRHSGTIGARLDHPARVAAFDMAADMSVIAALTTDENIFLHRPRTGGEASAVGTYAREPHSIKIRGDRVHVAGRERSMHVVSREGRPIRSYYDRLIPIVSAAVSGDGRWITIGDQAGGITVYDTAEGVRALERIDCPDSGSTSAVDTDSANGLIVAGGRDGRFRVVDYSGEPELRHFRFGESPVQAVRLVDGWAYVGNGRGLLGAFEPATGKLLQQYPGHSGNIRQIVAYRDRVASIDHGGSVCVFDRHSGRLIRRHRVPGTAYSLCIDELNERLYAGARNGEVYGWELDTGNYIARMPLNRSTPRSLTIAGNHLVSAGLNGDVKVMELDSGRTAFSVTVDSDAWTRFGCLNAAGDRLLTCGADGVMRFFCTGSGSEVAQGLHMPHGYLWTANGADAAEPEWVWTDRSDLLDVVAHEGSDSEILNADSEERLSFLLERNSRRTMGRVGFVPGIAPAAGDHASISGNVPIPKLTGPAD